MSRTTWENLNQIAEEWYRVREIEGEEAHATTLMNDLFTGAYQMVTRQADQDQLGSLFLVMRTFNPAVGNFESFLRKKIGYLVIDQQKEDNGVRQYKNEKCRPESLDQLKYSEGTVTALDLQADEMTATGLDVVLIDDTQLELLTAIMRMDQLLPGRANNETKKRYYTLFFTDGVSNYLRGEGETVYIKHERDLISVLSFPFLHWFTVERCETIREIQQSITKNYCDLVEGRGETPVRQPLPGDVYTTYAEKALNQVISAAAISQQHKSYREFLRERLS